MGGANDSMPHFVLVPLMAPGHMIPMVDLGRLLAARGATVSLITTPANAARIKPLIVGAEAAGLPIRFVVFDFPCAEAGVPEGCENFDSLPSKNLAKPFFTAISLLRDPLETYLREVHPRPSCIITDFCNWWTSEAARELRLPRFIFHGPSCFFILSSRNIYRHRAYDAAKDEFDPVVVPGLPQKIEISRAQSPGWFPGWEEMQEKVFKAEETATGVVINTFRELEADYIELYAKAIEKIQHSDTTCLNLTAAKTRPSPPEITNHQQQMVLPVGPFSLYNKDTTSKATRGNTSAVDGERVSRWLDGMEPRSVLFVSFGSVVRAQPRQLIEIGHGLESSNRPFVWVIKKAEMCPEVEKWLSEGFEERTGARGMIITGWAPQMVILSHPAVGGFVTHCGWNSILESVSSGVPLITWPFFVDQFLNEKLVVEVLRIGVPIGVKIPYYYFKEEEVAVGRDAVEKAIVTLMDGGEEGEERRVRAREFGEKAGKAMAEGGSSYENLTHLIQFVVEHCKQNDMQQEELQLLD